MQQIKLYVTYEVVTDESAKNGDVSERGYALDTRTPYDTIRMPDGLCGQGAIDWKNANIKPLTCYSVMEAAVWVTDYWQGGIWDYRDAIAEPNFDDNSWTSRTLHIECEETETWSAVIDLVQALEDGPDGREYAIVDLDTGTVLGPNVVIVHSSTDFKEMVDEGGDARIVRYAELCGWEIDGDEMP